MDKKLVARLASANDQYLGSEVAAPALDPKLKKLLSTYQKAGVKISKACAAKAIERRFMELVKLQGHGASTDVDDVLEGVKDAFEDDTSGYFIRAISAALPDYE